MSWLTRIGRRPVQGMHHLPLAGTEDIGESPIWPVAAVITAAGLYATLPSKFVAGAGSGAYGVLQWLVPVLTIVLIVPLALTVPNSKLLHAAGQHAQHVRLSRRVASTAVIALITVANGASIILLVHLLVNGAHTQANLLLKAGIHLWITNWLVFALWFWQLDGGGPLARRLRPTYAPDFLFPQQLFDEPELRWQPTFIDYLYVGFTNATAFSPTDAMPLTNWAKVLMMVQSAASLLLAIMVVARAVNILH